jgi:hypothetical protein
MGDIARVEGRRLGHTRAYGIWDDHERPATDTANYRT